MRKAILSTSVMLASVAGMALPFVGSAMPASAAASCTSTSKFTDSVGFTATIPTVGSNTHNDNCDLGEGNVSTAVGALQRDLNACYGAGLAVDNDYGPKTKAAVVTAQRDAGISADGIYGPQTRNNILWIFSGGSGSFCAIL
jgi:peptidoglycan hydrolase-like protein with peptidoglycan-binding domain